MFMDFTTQEPEANDIPMWTQTTPDNGTKIPTSGTGTWLFATAETGNAWATDNNGWSLQCAFDEDGWSVTTNVIGDFFVTQPAGSSQSTPPE